MNTNKLIYLFIPYALLSATFILIATQGIISSLPTVQERAYQNWFNDMEPQIWTNMENEKFLALPAISITTPTSRYLCAPTTWGCAVSVNQEQILRYLSLLNVSRAMRSAKGLTKSPSSESSIEVTIHQKANYDTHLCPLPSDSTTGHQGSFNAPVFTGILPENEGGIVLQNLLSLVEHSCLKIPS